MQGICLILFGLLAGCQGLRPRAKGAKFSKGGAMGCFKDSPRSSDLRFAVSRGAKAMTRSACKTLCQDLWYIYAAVQNGDTCWCGNSFGKYGYVDFWECNTTPCTGDEQEGCGGPLRNLIMMTDYDQGHKDDVNKCWEVEDSNGLTNITFKGALKSREQCRLMCGTFRKKYAAVAKSNRCFCGDYFFGNTAAKDEECNGPCRGNPSEVCGRTFNHMFMMHSLRAENDRGLLLVEGCYEDNGVKNETPLLDAQEMSLQGVTAAPSSTEKIPKSLCRAKCKQGGFKLAGVKYGSECWCTNTFNSHVFLMDEEHCTTPYDSTTTFIPPTIFIMDSGLEDQIPCVRDQRPGRHTCG